MNITLCSTGSLHNQKESARITLTSLATQHHKRTRNRRKHQTSLVEKFFE